MEPVFWQIDNPEPAEKHRSHIVNYGWYLLDGLRVHRLPNDRPDALVLLTVRGHPRCRHHGAWNQGRRGSVTLFLIGEEQEYLSDDTWEAFWFHFIPSPQLLGILRSYNVCTGRTWNGAIDEHDIQRMSEMFACEQLAKPLGFYRANVMCERLVLSCLPDPPMVLRKPRMSRLMDIAEYIRLNPASAHTVPALASMVNLSTSRFAHLFKEEFGMSVGAYIRTSRIDHAKHLLKATTMTATEIAYAVGYATPYAFYAAFKQVTGLRAAEFRKQ